MQRKGNKTLRTSLVAVCVLIVLAPIARADDAAPSRLLVCGTYEVLHYEDAFARDLLPGETCAEPRSGDLCDGRSWAEVPTQNGALDLESGSVPIKGRREVCAAYVFTWVRSESGQDATLLLGSDDGCIAWLNGEKVFETRDFRGLTPDQDAVPVKLESGWNRLLIKVVNGELGFGVSVKVRAAAPVDFAVDNPNPRSGKLLLLPASRITCFAIAPNGTLGVTLSAAIKNDSDRALPKPDIVLLASPSVTLDYDKSPLQTGETREAALIFEDPIAVFGGQKEKVAWRAAGQSEGEFGISPPAEDWLKILEPIPLNPSSPDRRIREEVTVGKEAEGLSARLLVDVQSGQVEVSSTDGTVTLKPGPARVDVARPLKAGREMVVSAVPKTGDTRFTASLQFLEPSLECVRENIYFAELLGAAGRDDIQRLETEFIDSRRGDPAAFDKDVASVAAKVRAIEPRMKSYTLDLIGHAHIDMAWLWRIPETKQVCRDTFSTMLKIMDETPDFKYAQSQMAAYEWMEKEQPEIFAGIKRHIACGQWVPVGGMWVEPDTSIPSGEALVRQFLLGKTYCRDKLGFLVKVGWLPDSFGHSWQMPQIMKKCGIEGYVFGRCSKPDTPLFWWEAADGSRVLGFWTGNYNGAVRDSVADDVLRFARDSGRKEELYLHGVGDHGGGPTYEDIANYKRLSQCAAAPTVRYESPERYFDKEIPEGSGLPVVRDELGFTFEGCYTTRSDTKRQNRKLEVALKQAETLGLIAREKNVNPRLLPAWKTLCFNQFHDIICGSAIHPVYEDANAMYAEAFDVTRKVTDDALHAIVGKSGGNDTITVFNTCEWERGGDVVFERPASLHGDAGIFLADDSGPRLPVRVRSDGKLEAYVPAVPACGSRTLRPVIASVDSARPLPKANEIENEYLRLAVDPTSGRVSSLVGKGTDRECIASENGAPLFRVLGDNGDGWNIGYTGESMPITESASVTNTSDSVAQSIRVKGGFGASLYAIDYILYPGDPKLYIRLAVDWHEHQKLLKMDFPVALGTGPDAARFEIPFGSIERPTDGNERPMQRWLSVRGGDGRGLAVLNDCKYGADVSGSCARVTLLRSSTSPDSNPDEGRHEIILALLPLEPETSDGAITRAAQEINEPLVAVAGSLETPESRSWVSVDNNGVVVSALKPAQDGRGIIVRLYEVNGKPADASLRLWAPVASAVETDMLEEGAAPLDSDGTTVKIHFSPWEIKTIRVRLDERR
jgi:alpha-mannosidase